MPKPGPEHARPARMAGEWSGGEQTAWAFHRMALRAGAGKATLSHWKILPQGEARYVHRLLGDRYEFFIENRFPGQHDFFVCSCAALTCASAETGKHRLATSDSDSSN